MRKTKTQDEADIAAMKATRLFEKAETQQQKARAFYALRQTLWAFTTLMHKEERLAKIKAMQRHIDALLEPMEKGEL